MAEVELRRVTKRFGALCAVDQLELTVRNGEILALVGPSGCGKSTVLNLIAGLERPSAGQVLIDGQSVDAIPPRQRNVGMVFQQAVLYPHMTVLQNLAFGPRARRWESSRLRASVHAIVELLGLADILARMPDELSGGQRQRVAIGRAIIGEPRVCLFDEPLGQLDAHDRADLCNTLVRAIHHTGATAVFVTHDQSEAMRMGDRLAVLRNGRLQQVDSPRRIHTAPQNRFVATFIGNPAMNIFAGVADRHFGEPRIRVGTHYIELNDAGDTCSVLGEPMAIDVGIRPEDLTLGDLAFGNPAFGNLSVPESSVLEFEVRLVSHRFLGSETVVEVECQSLASSLTIRVAGAWDGTMGGRLGVRVDPNRFHFFHASTGIRLPFIARRNAP